MSKIEDFNTYVQSKTAGYWVRRGVLAIAAITVVYLFTQYSVVSLSLSGIKGESNVTATTTTSAHSVLGIGDLYIVPRGTNVLVVADGDYRKTVVPVDIPWYSFTQASAEIVDDTNADKVAFHNTSSTACNAYHIKSESLLSYNCNRADTLQKYSTKDWQNNKFANLDPNLRSIKPFRGGVIGILYNANSDANYIGPIVTVDQSGKLSSHSAPRDIDMTVLNLATIYTDTKNPANDRFVLSAWTGELYLGIIGRGGNVTYEKINPVEDYNPSLNRNLCELHDDRVTCFTGEVDGVVVPEEGPDGSTGDEPPSANSTLTKYTYTGSRSEFKFQTRFVPGDIYQTADGRVYSINNKTLYEFVTRDGTVKLDIIATDVDTAGAGEKLYFASMGGVYELESGASRTSHQRFYSHNVIPAEISVYGDNIYIIGKIKGAGDTTYAYLLNEQPNTNPGNRLLDLIPKKFGELNGIGDMDFIGDKIRIKLLLSLPKNPPRNSNFSYVGEVQKAKINAEDELKNHGINVEQYSISYTY